MVADCFLTGWHQLFLLCANDTKIECCQPASSWIPCVRYLETILKRFHNYFSWSRKASMSWNAPWSQSGTKLQQDSTTSLQPYLDSSRYYDLLYSLAASDKMCSFARIVTFLWSKLILTVQKW